MIINSTRMAMTILSTRFLPTTMPLRALVTSTASMSSSAAPTTTKKKEVTTKDTTGEKKREGFFSAMATLVGGSFKPADPSQPNIPASKVDFPDIVEQATGEQKLFLLAFENGFLDPYCTLPVERNGRGTKDNPIPIESFTNERLVGCICEDTQNYIKYTWVHENEPKRCSCGHWMKLVQAPRFWEKIPKEDLVTIPYFRDLEEEGKLDALLAGKLDDDHDHGKH